MASKGKNRAIARDFAVFEDDLYSYSTQGPERKTPGGEDPLEDIIETLYSEHRYITSLLDTLEEQSQRLGKGKIPDYHLLYEILDYLIHYPEQYHHPREDLLFAQMLDSDKKFQVKLDRLLREHDTIAHFTRELYNELTRAVEGRPVNRPELQRMARRYITGYRKHIEYESKHIFPRASGSLTAWDVKRLANKTRHVDDPLFGGELQYRYRRLGRNIQSRVEVAGQRLVAREMRGIETGIEKIAHCVDALSKFREQWGKRSTKRR